MTSTNRTLRAAKASRMAMAAALALGTLAAVGATATPAFAQAKQKGGQAAPKITLSKPFQAAAVPVSQALDAAKVRADVVAATARVKEAQAAAQGKTGEAATQARAGITAAVAALGAALSAERAQVDNLFGVATTPDDRYAAGQLALNLGGIAQDNALQRRGLSAMIASGKTDPAILGRFHFFLGGLAFDAGDYAAARTSLEAAMAAGYRENDIDVTLADAYLNDNQVDQGLALLSQAAAQRRSAGQTPPISWYRRALGAAYKAKKVDAAAEWGAAFGEAHPNPSNWGTAITVVEQLARYDANGTLDLLRLMGRTNGFTEARDYMRYIESADPRRLPGEVLKVIESGTSSGILKASDSYVAESRTIANGRLAADRASLPSIERDARAANASGAALNSAGDVFLSYGDAAKAEEFYTKAIAKGGIDLDRALTRLGIAQVDQGKFDAAIATFARVSAARAPIAKLWSGYARQRLRPAA